MLSGSEVTYRRIFRLWLPLAATWLMMSVEGPFLAAVIARLADPTINLAAYGVAVAFAMIAEAPILMLLSAATALVKDGNSYRQLRKFAFGLNLLVTLVLLVALIPPVFDGLATGLVSLPADVAELTHRALVLLLPWPAAIGFRRFYQGLLIRQELTRRVAMGTVIRVVGMAAGALVLFHYFAVPGALVGAGALSTGVVLEAVGTRIMAFRIPGRIARSVSAATGETLTLRKIHDFYLPLALTSVIGICVQPMETFFVGSSRRPIESLAVLPVISATSFVFRSVALSYQEVAIALLDGSHESYRRLASFAVLVGGIATFGLALVAFTPLSEVWFGTVAGLSPELAAFSILPLRLLSPMPFLSVLLALQRAVLVFGRITRPATVATIIEVSAVVAVLFLTIRVFDFTGAIAAVVALLSGRVLGSAYLTAPCRLALTTAGIEPRERREGARPSLLDRRDMDQA